MASKPGILTDWPWSSLGTYKYVVIAPWSIYWTYAYMVTNEKERNLSALLVLPVMAMRVLHNQFWISLSRYRTAKGNNRIVDKSIEFEQVDREENWDDQIMFNGILFYLGTMYIPGIHQLPLWRTDGVLWAALLHTGPVEFLYYWLHRALHHHFLYSRYHSHHHSSIVTEPITSVIHPFAEHVSYSLLFALPLISTLFMGTASIVSVSGYMIYIDFMNNMGHCNFEHVPKWFFDIFPPLKYIMYTPSYHSLHHTQFRTNYSLFMPFYDYIYGTMDKSSDTLYESALVRKEDEPDVVHLTHLTTPDSIYHLRVGFAHFAAQPHKSKWYLWLLWPITLWSMMITWIYGKTFVVERNVFKNLKMQTWAIPKYSVQYFMQWQRESINSMIEEAILHANEKGAKVLSLGLLNQEEGVNRYGEIFVKRNPELKVKIVDGTSLAVAVVLKSIPKGTTQVVLQSNLSKAAYSIALALCQSGVQVFMTREDEYKRAKGKMSREAGNNFILAKHSASKIWLVGDALSEEEQQKASKGTVFIPISQFPPKKTRKDCVYYNTPSMLAPKHLENVDSCENWLPRRVMSAWRIAGMIHAMEGWKVNECGNMVFDIEKIWQASLDHGFRPLAMSAADSKMN